jgi:integrase
VQIAEFGIADEALMSKARLWAQEFREGRDPIEASREAASAASDGMTLSGLFDEYIRVRGTKLRPSSVALYRKILKNYVAGLAAKKITDLKPLDFVNLYQGLVQEKSAATANVTLDMLRAVFRFGVDLELLEKSPVEGAQRQKIRVASGVRSRVVTEAELPAWWKAVTLYPEEFPFSVMMRMAILTGARRGELAGMVWDEVDLQRGVWTIPGGRTKNGKSRVIPFTKHVTGLMDRAREFGDEVKRRNRNMPNGGLVFFVGGDNVLRPAKRAVSNFQVPMARVAREGGPLVSWHDLRRAWSSFAAMTPGVQEIVRRKVLGHSMQGVTEVHYTVVGVEDIRAGMQLVEDRILAMAGVAGR